MGDLSAEEVREERDRIVADIRRKHEQLADLYGELDTLQQRCEHGELTELVVFGQPVRVCPDCSWNEQE